MRGVGRRRKKKRDQGTIELNLAAMLDMAFQLLTFFILTFRPAPVEGQLSLNLPPPVSQASPPPPSANDSPGIGDVLAPDLLHLRVVANDRGDVSDLKIETESVIQGSFDEANTQRFDRSLQARFKIKDIPFERIQIAVDGRLRYGELMKIIDVCHRQKLPDGTNMQKISFTEVDAGAAPN